MALSDLEKDRVRYHLGYLGVSFAGSYFFGLPRPSQTAFMLETSMQHVLPQREGTVRELIARCDSTEQRLFESQERLAASRMGEITLRENEQELLEEEYKRWANRLADCMGVPLYPYSARFQGGVMSGMINRR